MPTPKLYMSLWTDPTIRHWYIVCDACCALLVFQAMTPIVGDTITCGPCGHVNLITEKPTAPRGVG